MICGATISQTTKVAAVHESYPVLDPQSRPVNPFPVGSDMASSRGIRRTQRLTHKLQLALAISRPFSPECEVNVGSHICLLPCAMEERIVEMDRTRRSRAPSPEQMCPKELVSQQHDARQVSSPIKLFLCHDLTRYERRANPERKEPHGRFTIYWKEHERWLSSYIAFMYKVIY